MKLNGPLPQTLAKECVKAAAIFQAFVDKTNNGLDGIIPGDILEYAKGFAILTVIKAGFLFSARAGSGLVIVKLSDGTWSAPSAIGTAGMGLGGQLGAEVTDLLIVLNSRAACRQFMSGGSFSLGGNISVAIGPLGRNGEASASVSSRGVAAMYSYSRSKGLFGGISIEGSVIIDREDTNALAYNSPVSAQALLTGAVPLPEWAEVLVKAIDACTGLPGNRKWVNELPSPTGYGFGGLGSPGSKPVKKQKNRLPEFPPVSWGAPKETGSYFEHHRSMPAVDKPEPLKGRDQSTLSETQQFGTDQFATQFESDFLQKVANRPSLMRHKTFPTSLDTSLEPESPLNPFLPPPMRVPSLQMPTEGLARAPLQRSHSISGPATAKSVTGPFIKAKHEILAPLTEEGVAKAVAMYDFAGIEPGDLSFSSGDVITILEKSESTQDWWRGKLKGQVGIFPANFVELVGFPARNSQNPFH